MLGGRIGIALGSGGARGFAHVGVLRELVAAGIVPDVVCGASVGAVVGAVYAAGHLDDFESWARRLDRRGVLALLDVSFSGGALRGRRMMEQIATFLPDGDIDALPAPFAAVATDLESGREVWLQRGPLVPALHASSAIPGVVSPVRIDGRWLIDGGIVNPVPIALCRALGAETVIAVDLNASLLARRFRGEPDAPPAPADDRSPGALGGLWSELRQRFVGPETPSGPHSPGLYDVLNNALEIMQVRITRSRMAGDPPDLLVTPRLPDFALFDLHRAADAIEEGRRATAQALVTLAGDQAAASAHDV
ncbi:MAG TPA: patatin-like phospholipase family protein [Myxococcota bacterium]|nr:patatin-like phospholipase family protein [Myxococcota bacterium]